MVEVRDLVAPSWGPMRHIEAGWTALSPEEKAEVADRLAAVADPHDERRSAATFFAFLAQVETIAIEIPLRFLPVAPDAVRPLLRRQLVDEVFHSLLFARIAHRSSRRPPSVASAERLLDQIRAEDNLHISATLLNLVAEGWIENLFRHAATWGVADEVFQTVLADESRHVEEASVYLEDFDPKAAAPAVARLESGLLQVMREPAVGLAMADLAGDRYADLVDGMHEAHRRHLAEVGLQPSDEWEANQRATEEFLRQWKDQERAELVPDTPWRASARKVWDTPRDPSMQGDIDLRVGRIPKRALTPVLVAAIGRAWAKHPELNRLQAKDGVWQLPKINVGVRVLVDDTELATVVVTDADRRSVRDIGRMIMDGLGQLEAVRRHQKRQGVVVEPFDDRMMGMADPGPTSFSVAISNPGKFGLVRGAGAFSGEMAPSTDISVGQRRRLPVWRGIGYFPAWHVNLGCLQDHRVFDGREAGIAMQAVREQLRPHNLRQIMKAPDTLGPDIEPSRLAAAMPPEIRALSAVGFTKYLPVAIGAAAGAAGLGVAAYYLIQQGTAGAVGAAGASTPGAASAAGGTDGALAGPAGSGGCHGTKASGDPCNAAADETGFCHHHRGA